MARRLTDQQRRRIHSHQQRKRNAVTDVAELLDDTLLGAEQEALVIAHYGSQLDVELLSDTRAEPAVVRCALRANIAQLVTGDHVIVRLPAEEAGVDAAAVVVAACERHSLLSRPDSRGLLRPVAANIDAMLITIAPRPEPFPFLIDRYLVAADMHEIQPVILCNKTDLIDDSNRDHIETLLSIYRAIGYPVFSVSSHEGVGLESVEAFLSDKTAVVVGQSGVGKSSLIRALLPGIEIATGALSEMVDKGKHTTTTARLYHLPKGGNLIDSPGIREFTLQHVPAQQLLSHFVDLRDYADHCRFRDCQHQHEPDCALLAAEASGAVFPERLASYRHILSTLKN
ncbi:MAG TPA: small ribosomal subunit biogenesis GTPase RsgA [Pseudomonadales bacterium]|nr:small ribosomal subunit biogenesis GTPase RsgA [Pseudomonadales bacterium]